MAGTFNSKKLLTLGVGSRFIFDFRYDLGGIAVYVHTFPFSVLGPQISKRHSFAYNLGSRLAVQWTMPFDISGALLKTWRFPFDIIASGTTVSPSAPPGSVYNGQPGTVVTTTITVTAPVGSTTITVSSPTGIIVGQTIVIGSEPRTITGIAGPVLTLDTPTQVSHPSGTQVVTYPGTVTTGSASAGDTTITVSDVTGLAVGVVIRILTPGGQPEIRSVIAISGTTITLSAPLSSAQSAGATVSAMQPGFVPYQLSVFNKQGVFLGALQKSTVTSSRSRTIAQAGQMAFIVPASHPDALLVKDDCIIAVTSGLGMPIWAGSIGRQEWSNGQATVNVPDVLELFNDVPIVLTEAEYVIEDNTTAASLYQFILDKLNDVKSAHNEVLWTANITGSKLFRGDLQTQGDAFSYMTQIKNRSQTEFAWEANIYQGQLSLTFIAADSLGGTTGVPFTDGVGGNVVEDPKYVRDPSTRTRGLKLTGAASEITKYMPDWAHWAAKDVTPTVELTLPEPSTVTPGDARFRQKLEVSVDWGLSKTEQRRLAQLTMDRLWQMYYSFLYAWHDLKGMPFHPKWEYEGPPENLEAQLTLDSWVTHNQMASISVQGTIAHIVGYSASEASWLVVIYYLSTETKVTRIYGTNQVWQYPLPTGTLPVGTSVQLYEVVGSSAAPFATYTWQTGDAWLLYYPVVVVYGSTTITLRGIVNGPFSGRYVNVSANPWTLVYPPPSVVIDSDSTQIGQIFPIERARVVEWDPRRDGVGQFLSKPTVFNGLLTTRPRWHIVPFTTGEAVETTLTDGLYHYDTTIYVESTDGFPIDKLPGTPFTVRLSGSTNTSTEDVEVIAAVGTRWTVRRGVSLTTTLTADANSGDTVVSVTAVPADSTNSIQRAVIIGGVAYSVSSISGLSVTLASPISLTTLSGGTVTFTTSAILWETGSTVNLIDGVAFDGFDFGYNWPEGYDYAQSLLDDASKDRVLLSINVINRNDTWASVGYGTVHDVNLTTEGPGLSVVGTCRVIGWAPDEVTGKMEVVVEML